MEYKRYFLKCCHDGFQSSRQAISKITGDILIAAVGALVVATLSPYQFLPARQTWFSEFANGTLSFIFYAIGAWCILFITSTLFAAPYRIYKRQEEKIDELNIVDQKDLERLLDGKFLNGHTFLYRVHDLGYICHNYKSGTEIKQLKDVFTKIPARAPKHSIARIEFQPVNFSSRESERCFFYYKHGDEVVQIENI